MIQYTLRCDQGHGFDSWFKSSEAFDKLAASGLVTCAVCGSAGVGKAMMSPRVATSRRAAARRAVPEAPVPGTPAPQPVAMSPDPELRRALSELRKRIEAQSDYVGDRFAREARAMHLGEVPERPIYGQATPSEARGLIDDGVPVMPLPFTPTRKTN